MLMEKKILQFQSPFLASFLMCLGKHKNKKIQEMLVNLPKPIKQKTILAPSHLIRALLKSSSNSVKDLAASTKTPGLLQKHQVF